MNRVKMLKSQNGSHDGFTEIVFREGQEYDVADDLLAAFIEIGCAELVTDKAAVTASPENKAIMTAPETKRGKKRK